MHKPWKCPIAIRPLVDKKLDKLVEQEVIVPVMEPTDWVSSLAYSWKADGDLRTCLNPTHLNKAIRQDHYRTPTLEVITHVLLRENSLWFKVLIKALLCNALSIKVKAKGSSSLKLGEAVKGRLRNSGPKLGFGLI